MEIRPKSIATVVVVLSGTAATSSTPIDAAVSASSVSSGGISESVRTIVVLPTPKPLATTIFSGISVVSARTEALQETDQQGGVRTPVAPGGHRLVHREVLGAGEVADQDPGHSDGHAKGCADLHERDGVFRHLEYHPVLLLHPLPRSPTRHGDERLDRELAREAARASPGDGVHRDDPAAVVDLAGGLVTGGHRADPQPDSTRTPGSSAWPTRAPSMAI